MASIKFYWKLVKSSVSKFLDDDVSTYAAALAYYTIFSLPPILLVVLTVGSWFYDREAVNEAIFSQVGNMISERSAQQLAATVQRIEVIDKNWWATALGIGVLLFSSTTVLVTIQNALNHIFKVKAKPDSSGFWKMVRNRLISFAMILGFAFILLVSLLIDAAIAAFGDYASQFLPDISVALTTVINLIIPLFITALLFALIFKYLPDVQLSWRDTVIGATITAVLFILGKNLIGFYIGNSDTANLYNAAGSVLVVLVWVYYASSIFLFGGVFVYLYTHQVNGKIDSEEYAVQVEEVEKS